MSTAGLPTIWELLEEAAGTLPEPFSRAALINWVSARRPDVGRPSIAAHIQFATDNAAGAGAARDSAARDSAARDSGASADADHATANPFTGRTPLLHRVDRGLYLRYRPPASDQPRQELPAVRRVVLIGSSGEMASVPSPAGTLFLSSGFARARAYAEHSGLPWFVLSARHGLLDPGELVTPYDVGLGDQSVSYRTAWGEWVVAQLAERLRLPGAVVEVHGGVDFAQPLRHPLAQRGAGLDLSLPGAWRERDAADTGAADTGAADTGEPRNHVASETVPWDDEPHDSPGRAALGRLRHLVTRGAPR